MEGLALWRHGPQCHHGEQSLQPHRVLQPLDLGTEALIRQHRLRRLHVDSRQCSIDGVQPARGLVIGFWDVAAILSQRSGPFDLFEQKRRAGP